MRWAVSGANSSACAIVTRVAKDYHWINISLFSAAGIKDKAVLGGKNGAEPLYICRAQQSDGVHSGKYLPSSGLCYIGWGGKEVTVNTGFEVLKAR